MKQALPAINAVGTLFECVHVHICSHVPVSVLCNPFFGTSNNLRLSAHQAVTEQSEETKRANSITKEVLCATCNCGLIDHLWDEISVFGSRLLNQLRFS